MELTNLNPGTNITTRLRTYSARSAFPAPGRSDTALRWERRLYIIFTAQLLPILQHMKPSQNQPTNRPTPSHKHAPIRMCVICRKRFPKSEIVRYTCPQEGETALQPDPTGKIQGRGFYVCTSSECMKKIKKFRGWQKKCRERKNDH